jgi:ParB-like chromosome segregation protein Spo0J
LNKITEQLLPLAIDVAKLVPAKSNPRKGDIDAIKKSYERFGQRKPIVALKGSSEIIAGNHQYQAALDLGWDKIAVVFVEDDAETATAYSIADNRIGQLGEWNVEELVMAFEKIDFADFDSIGFSETDVEDYRALLDEQSMNAPAMPTASDGRPQA